KHDQAFRAQRLPPPRAPEEGQQLDGDRGPRVLQRRARQRRADQRADQGQGRRPHRDRRLRPGLAGPRRGPHHAAPPRAEGPPPPGATKAGRTTIPPTMGQRPSTGITQPQISAPPPVDTPPMPIPAPGAASTPNATVGGATAIIRVTDLMKPALQVEARDLSKSEMPRLMGISGSVRGKEFFLMRTEVKIGRSEDNDISIDHQSLSRQHARFVLEDGSWKVVDNKSANGVHINGELYAISAVRPGDTVELGHLKFRFCGPGEKFTLPSDKEEAKPGLRPTTAELIAGAREAPKAPAAKKSKLPLALGAGALVVAVVVAFLLVGRPKKVDENGEPELSAGEAIK